MTRLFEDTDPRVEEMLIEMMRQASPERKMRMVAQMNYTVRSLMIAGIKERNPEASPKRCGDYLPSFSSARSLPGRCWITKPEKLADYERFIASQIVVTALAVAYTVLSLSQIRWNRISD
ncbi:MAG: hypothetical protein L0Z70_05680 [Chloroflexi bacterium]|nr:hypothetical protein [Chloroflexota bacterium]